MRVLFTASLACLVAISLTPRLHADEEQDPFGGAAQHPAGGQILVDDPNDPFGVATSRPNGMGREMSANALGHRMRFHGPVSAFTVVTNGKRTIKINTMTGDSWLLVIDQEGSHWQTITSSESSYPPPSQSRESLERERADLGVDGQLRVRDAQLAGLKEVIAMQKNELALAKKTNRSLLEQVNEHREEIAVLKKTFENTANLQPTPTTVPAEPDDKSKKE